MKKLSKLLALLLALAIVFSLTECAASEKDDEEKDDETTSAEEKDDKGDKDEEEEDKKDKEDKEDKEDKDEEEEKDEEITGEWLYRVDVSDALEASMGDMDGIALPEAAFYLNVTFEFEKDTFVMAMALDKDSFDDYLDELIVAVIDAAIEESGMSKEDFDAMAQEEFGMSAEEYFEELMAETLEGSFDDVSFEEEFFYKLDAKKGRIYMAEDEDALEDEEEYMEYTLKGDKLTIEGMYDASGEVDLEEFEELGMELPWKFEKQ